MEIVLTGMLILLLGVALAGGLMSWVVLSRLRRLQRRFERLQARVERGEAPVAGPAAQSQAASVPSDKRYDAQSASAISAGAASGGKLQDQRSVETRATSSQHGLLTIARQQLRDNWMIWLGGLCIALAGVFLVKYSIDQGLLGPTARIVLAAVIGVAFHAAAEILRRRTRHSHPSFAALAGGASITLFAAVLAALHLYHLISPGLAFILLALIALATMALSLLHGPVLAAIGILGAYIVPLLVSKDYGDILSALIYSLIISASALLLMRYVYRSWLWYGTLVGALGWWLISFTHVDATGYRGYYLAALAYGMLAIPGFDWLLSGASSKRTGSPDPAAPATRAAELPVTVSLLLLILAHAVSIAYEGFSSDALLRWSPLVLVVVIAATRRESLAILPWSSLASQWVAWLYCGVDKIDGRWQLAGLDPHWQQPFLLYAAAMSALYSGLGAWLLRGRPYHHLQASLVAMAPVCWLALAYLLVTDLSRLWQWSVASLALGLGYIVLSQWQLKRERQAVITVWLILAAHLAYSLAVAMLFREATLTLALSTQLVSLAWLIRRFDLNGLDWLVKAVLALVVVRLTFNPWLLTYPVDVHWSLWTYGGSTLCCVLASRLVAPERPLRPWLEAVGLQLLVLFIAAETRYQLYDGEIFRRQYSLTEAAINTALWSALGLVYYYRARHSEILGRLYLVLSKLLMVMATINYLAVVTVLNPLWSSAQVAATPVFNLMLLAYGLPPVIALLVSRVYPPTLRPPAALIAGGGFLVFVSMQIRHLWQGDLDPGKAMIEGELYTYSAAWLALAVLAVLYAGPRGQQNLYRAGMALLMVVIAKLFLVDMDGLEGLWRVASFMGLGLSLLALAYLHQRVTGAQNGKVSRTGVP